MESVLINLQQGSAQSSISESESRIFWLALIVSQLFWIVFMFTSLFRLNFKWFVSIAADFVATLIIRVPSCYQFEWREQKSCYFN